MCKKLLEALTTSRWKKTKAEQIIRCEVLSTRIKEVNDEIHNLTSKTSGYIYEYSYRENLQKWQLFKINLPNLRQYRKISLYQELLCQSNQLKSQLTNLEANIAIHNQNYLKNAIANAYKKIGNIEGRPLDNQQMTCIVKDAPNHLVIAGAGTGKTTTILGKVKYLLATNACKPDEILVLSFTNASAGEMQKRLEKETQLNIHVSTFHGLGLEIIRKTEGKVPIIYQDSLLKFIRGQIECCMEKEEYAKLLISYLLYHKISQKSEFEFDSKKSYQEFLQSNPPITIKGEAVKSYGEMEIANFLTQYGVKYQYEELYRIDTRTEKYKQYCPDFYLPDYDIYIEYFGINRKGEVPAYFTGSNGKTATDVYREGMAWKRSTHQKNGTSMIECYAYEKADGVLQKNLRQKLMNHHVSLNSVDVNSLFEQMEGTKNNTLDGMTDLFQKILSLVKNKRLTPEQLLDMCNSSIYSGQKVLVHLFRPIYDAYQNQLKDSHAIDFNDMIHLAADYVQNGRYHHPFRYIIIDEYQDISGGQYALIKAMREESDFSLFCVGDDWQSIYRFAGSDIGYILNFAEYWGDTEISRIEITYRFSQKLIDISSNFIMKNSNQIRKSIRAANDTEQYVFDEIQGNKGEDAIKYMVSKIEGLPKNSTVFLIGRYTFDKDLLKKEEQLRMQFNNFDKSVDVQLSSRPDLKIAFYTAHKSKGLQADYVFIINNRDKNMGFPSRMQNVPLIDLLLEKADHYPDAEERRLFYVAMTRARKRVYLVTIRDHLSVFAKELESSFQKKNQEKKLFCPRCGALLVKRNGKYGMFYGCTNYPKTGCNYILSRNVTHVRKINNTTTRKVIKCL